MQEPSYHLSGVVKSKDDYEDFTGPLDVILMLLSKNRIEIRDIQISLLLDQYLAWLREQQELNLDVASEFVQMASHLTYIKTRMLLTSDKEEVSELAELVEQLEKLQDRDTLAAVRQVIPELTERSREGLRLHVKEPMTVPGKWEYSFSAEDILTAMAGLLLQRGGEKEPEDEVLLRAIPSPVTYSITEKSRELTELLREKKHVALTELYGICHSRSELVATLLSLLELCHNGVMAVEQQDHGWTVRALALEEEEHGDQ